MTPSPSSSASINFQKASAAVKPNAVAGGPARQREVELVFAKCKELANNYFPPKPSESESAAWPQVRDDIANYLGRALVNLPLDGKQKYAHEELRAMKLEVSQECSSSSGDLYAWLLVYLDSNCAGKEERMAARHATRAAVYDLLKYNPHCVKTSDYFTAVMPTGVLESCQSVLEGNIDSLSLTQLESLDMLVTSMLGTRGSDTETYGEDGKQPVVQFKEQQATEYIQWMQVEGSQHLDDEGDAPSAAEILHLYGYVAMRDYGKGSTSAQGDQTFQYTVHFWPL